MCDLESNILTWELACERYLGWRYHNAQSNSILSNHIKAKTIYLLKYLIIHKVLVAVNGQWGVEEYNYRYICWVQNYIIIMKFMHLLLKLILLHFDQFFLLIDLVIVVQMLVWTVSHTKCVKFAAYRTLLYDVWPNYGLWFCVGIQSPVYRTLVELIWTISRVINTLLDLLLQMFRLFKEVLWI